MMRQDTEEQTQTGSRPKARHDGAVSQDASYNTAKCKYHKMQILHEKPDGATNWSTWVGVPGTGTSGGTMRYHRAM